MNYIHSIKQRQANPMFPEIQINYTSFQKLIKKGFGFEAILLDA